MSKTKITHRGTLETWQSHICVTVALWLPLVFSDCAWSGTAPCNAVLSPIPHAFQMFLETILQMQNLCIIFPVWKLTLLVIKTVFSCGFIMQWIFQICNYHVNWKKKKRLCFVVFHILPDIIHYCNKSWYWWLSCFWSLNNLYNTLCLSSHYFHGLFMKFGVSIYLSIYIGAYVLLFNTIFKSWKVLLYYS